MALVQASLFEVYCQCGCGKKAPIARKTRPDRGQVKGYPIKFLPGHSDRWKEKKILEQEQGAKRCGQCKNIFPLKNFDIVTKKLKGKPLGTIRLGSCFKCITNSRAKWRDENKDKFRRQLKCCNLRKLYGITLLQYEQMCKDQNNVCAICGLEDTRVGPMGRKKGLCVDHDHETGVVRGLLCSRCNNGLGCYKEKIELLEKASDYLRHHNKLKGV